MTVRASLSGPPPDPQQRTYLMGQIACPNCGQRSCDRNCGEGMPETSGYNAIDLLNGT